MRHEYRRLVEYAYLTIWKGRIDPSVPSSAPASEQVSVSLRFAGRN